MILSVSSADAKWRGWACEKKSYWDFKENIQTRIIWCKQMQNARIMFWGFLRQIRLPVLLHNLSEQSRATASRVIENLMFYNQFLDLVTAYGTYLLLVFQKRERERTTSILKCINDSLNMPRLDFYYFSLLADSFKCSMVIGWLGPDLWRIDYMVQSSREDSSAVRG